ncbi:YadA-like family protein [Taylorella equigenitalis]|uniref:YadA-like family protein n=4 Tax=Taylorella equigenitalis TaxID=29575 RepID=UPI0023B07F60|nr:YadA-like family protein [Taylorella equigenitalis]WEE01841.1 YadA-like family protein [Taylorella equigenitalis]WFD79856.1 YadA-like family protein [Taylorella equigenitalis]WFD81332.1 YadA-like family protein [Taylorella equigenitalis]WFD82811.1 YadA-like family protein [Taylorella equigenitalis]WFD99750.1 YadA-like family protein [Taylorella equigenitalis]
MNKIFKSKFNTRIGAWVAVSELARGFTKNSRALHATAIVLTAFSLGGGQVLAQAQNNNFEIAGGVVEAGATNSLAFGKDAKVKTGELNFAIGKKASIEGTDPSGKLKTRWSLAFGWSAKVTGGGKNNIAIGQESLINTSGNDNFAFGWGAKVEDLDASKQKYSTGSFALGSYASAKGDKVFALGHNSKAVGNNSIAIGNSSVQGNNSVAIFGSVNGVDNSVAIGGHVRYDPKSPLNNNSTAVGYGANTFGWSSNALGYQSISFREGSAQGYRNYSFGKFSSSIGAQNITVDTGSSAIGFMNKALVNRSVAIGASNFAGRAEFLGQSDVEAGYYDPNWHSAKSTKKFNWLNAITSDYKKLYGEVYSDKKNWLESTLYIWMGGVNREGKVSFIENNKYIKKGLTDNHEVTIGEGDAQKTLTLKLTKAYTDALQEQFYAMHQTSVGSQNVATGHKSSAIGFGNVAIGNYSAAVGYGTMALASNSLAYGNKTIVEGKNSSAFGQQIYVAPQNSMAAGSRNLILEGGENTFVLGSDIETNLANSVFLGANSKSEGYGKPEDAPKDYQWAGVVKEETDPATPSADGARQATKTLGVVSVGSAGNERQIQHVAAGRINKDSTDAVNGSQLFVVADDLAKKINNLTGQSPSIMLQGDLGTTQTLPLSNVINIVGSNTTAGDLITGNIGVEVKEGNVEIKLSKKLTGIESINFGDSVVLNKELVKKIQNFDPSSGGTGSSTKQLNIADDAGTKAQPKEDTVQLVGGAKDSSDNNIKTVVDTKDKEKVHIKLAKNLKGLESLGVTDENGVGTVITRDGIYINLVEKDEDGNPKKGSDGKPVTKKVAMGTSYAGDDGKKVDIPLNKTLNIKGGATDVSTENNVGVVKGDDSTLNIRLSKNLKGIESIDGLKEMSYDDMQDSSNDNKAVSVKSMKNYIEKYGTPGGSGGSDFNGDAGGKEITNLKPGTKSNSAATVGQLEERYDDALGASAMAMATGGLPQATAPGKSMVAVAGSTLEGKQGYAIGISTVSKSGKWVLKGSVAGSSRSHLGATVGAGYQW